MKLSTNWLNEFLPLDGISSEEVASKLTMGAFEVEDIYKTGAKLKGPIVISKILDIQKHPNADRLSIVEVTTDSKNKLQIVCGAKNIKVGDKVPLSQEGAIVKNRKDGSELQIKTSKIRGVESSGMLCAAAELGLENNEPDGILILPQNAPIGQDVINFLSLGQDTVLEVAARSNRGDALSVSGLAREISALTKKKLKELSFKTPKFDSSVKNVESKIENTNDAYVFYTATIQNIKVKESPTWLKSLLSSVNIRSVNNIVDITNYINFSFGQPMHAYDKEKLHGNCLTSRNAKNGEEIVTLDGKHRTLKEGVLVIADNKNPVAIAGIMGGKDSEVTDATSEITLEAAVFNPVKVRKASRKTGLASEASKRFERGVDSSFTYSALLKAIELIEHLAQNDTDKIKISSICKAGEPIKKEVKLQISTQMVHRVLGVDLKAKEIIGLLESIGFSSKEKTKDTIEILVPQNRTSDVTRPIDLVEEIARLYGYDNIPPLPPSATLSAKQIPSATHKLKGYFLSAGFSECYLTSLIGENILSHKEFEFNSSKSVSMNNPLSREHSILRQSLLPGLLEALHLNQAYQISPVKLFETGKVYLQDTKANDRETGVKEKSKLAFAMYSQEESWYANKNLKLEPIEHIFFSGKGILENFFYKHKIDIELTKNKEPFLHPKLSLSILLKGNHIGSFGILHPSLESKFQLQGPAVVCEMNTDLILLELEEIPTYKKISSQPIVERDITVDLLKSHEANSVLKEIMSIKSNFVQSVKLTNTFDLDSNNKSLTYRFKMQDFKETLTANQVDHEVNKIKNHLIACFQAKFRV